MAVQIEVAPPRDRFIAAAIDLVPPFLLFIILGVTGMSGAAALLALLGSVYFIFRDVVGNGQSLGKRLCSLQVVDSETDRVPEPMALILRNLGFGVPGLNVIYALVEGIRVLQHPQGLRFGDAFAETGVVKVPPDDRAKLLEPKKERPSRESKAVADAAPPEGAVEPSGDAAASPPAAVPASPAAPVSSRPKPVPATPAKPGSPPPPPTSAPAKTRAPIDLPDEPVKPAAPLPSPPPPAAPPAGAPGVALGKDDPLKKLVDQATAKK